jgi:type VI secretion system secreted protein Hcp
MATNMYIKFEEPSVTGTGTGEHAGEIEILSWSHGFSQASSPTRGSAEHQNLTFTKYLDTASTALIKYCWSGQQFKKVTLSCYRSDGTTDNKPERYLTVVMEHVVISNFSVSGGPGDVPVENISLDYGVVQYNYFEQKKSGGLKAAKPLRAKKPAAKKEA